MKMLIGVSGLAGSGKDLYYKIASDILGDSGYTTIQFSLAHELKQSCAEYLKNEFKFDVWTEDRKIKELFRPYLVWYAHMKRLETHGKYYTSLLQKEIDNWATSKNTVGIITDIRYCDFPEDEIFWLLGKDNGKLVHVSQFKLDADNNKIFQEPPNDHERRNDPVIKTFASHLIEWERIILEEPITLDTLKHNPYLRAKVKESLKHFKLNV